MAADDFDPYEILGVEPGATAEQIRAAYRENVARYHPDKHRGNPLAELAEARLRDINRAYEALSRGRARQEGRRTTPRPAAPARAAPPRRAGEGGRQLVSWIVSAAVLVFVLRFGLVVVRELLAVLRAFSLLAVRLGRFGPVAALAVLFAVAMLVSYALRRRRSG